LQKNRWTWLVSTLNTAIDISSIDTIMNICNRSWSPQCKIVIIVANINLIDVIWFCRNKKRLDNNIISWKSASLVANNSK
jgi:hypothetical protein